MAVAKVLSSSAAHQAYKQQEVNDVQVAVEGSPVQAGPAYVAVINVRLPYVDAIPALQVTVPMKSPRVDVEDGGQEACAMC